MIRKRTVVLFAVLVVAMLAMTSCGKSEFYIGDNTEKTMTVTAVNAAKDSMGMVGTLEVEEGEQIAVTGNLEKGTVRVEFFGTPEDQSIEEVPDMDGEPVCTANVSGTDMNAFEVSPGSYMLRASVLEKATGEVNIEVKPMESEKWKTAASVEEAGENAGVGLFIADPSGTSLGDVFSSDFSYMEGVAEGHYGVAAVEMYIRKGLADIDGGDVSFDNDKYKFEWTVDMDGTEVKCFGNRDGEATKSIWTKGDYCYAILAYGAGGDTDFGLKPDDLAAVYKTIQ